MNLAFVTIVNRETLIWKRFIFLLEYLKMFSSEFSFRFLLISMLLPIFAKSEPYIFIPRGADVNSCELNGYAEGISGRTGASCPFSNLHEVMADEEMAQVIADKNVFQTIERNDVVRLRRDIGLYWFLNPLRRAVNNTYKSFYETVQRDFALNITTYPSEIREGTCADHSTIVKAPIYEHAPLSLQALFVEGQEQSTLETLGVERRLSDVFGNYLAVEGRDPRHFEMRKDQSGDIVICEASTKSLEERMDLHCGGGSNECESQMPPLCSEWDEAHSQILGRGDMCADLNAFEKASWRFLLYNKTMKRFCPGDCSYYIQLLQRVHEGADERCAETHAIVHCGPKKVKATYNLNIKVVDNFCEDFNVMCTPADSQLASY